MRCICGAIPVATGRSFISYQREKGRLSAGRLCERLGMRPRIDRSDDRQVEAAIYRMVSELR
jgi:hypothetical protein